MVLSEFRARLVAGKSEQLLLAHSRPQWVERYEARMEDARTPLGEEARHAFRAAYCGYGLHRCQIAHREPAGLPD
jgi:hypothetical protein